MPKESGKKKERLKRMYGGVGKKKKERKLAASVGTLSLPLGRRLGIVENDKMYLGKGGGS